MAGCVRDNERGIALFLVLWVLTLLSVIVGEFCFAMRTDVNITRNFKEQTEAYYIALAGMNRAISEMVRNEVILEKVKSKDREEKLEDVGGDEERPRWRVNADIPSVPYGRGQFEIRIDNESGKVNINGANGSLLRIMLSGFDLDDNQESIIVDSILDWRDKNDLHRLNGAEDDYYKSLSRPYNCKNGDFDSVEELLMVRGVTPEIFYGGLRDIVTVFKPPERRVRLRAGYKVVSAPVNKININAASREVLLVLPSMTEELAEEIINYRKDSDFKALTEISSIVGPEVYKAIAPFITLKASPFYTIVCVGKVEGADVEQGVEGVVEIGKKLRGGYRVIQWRDSLGDCGEESSATTE